VKPSAATTGYTNCFFVNGQMRKDIRINKIVKK